MLQGNQKPMKNNPQETDLSSSGPDPLMCSEEHKEVGSGTQLKMSTRQADENCPRYTKGSMFIPGHPGGTRLRSD